MNGKPPNGFTLRAVLIAGDLDRKGWAKLVKKLIRAKRVADEGRGEDDQEWLDDLKALEELVEGYESR